MHQIFCAEIADYGYPQKTDTAILKTFITQQGVKTQVRKYKKEGIEKEKMGKRNGKIRNRK